MPKQKNKRAYCPSLSCHCLICHSKTESRYLTCLKFLFISFISAIERHDILKWLQIEKLIGVSLILSINILNKCPEAQRCVLKRIFKLTFRTCRSFWTCQTCQTRWTRRTFQTFRTCRTFFSGWAGLKHFYSHFRSGFTIIYGENYAFLPLFTKASRTNGRTDGPTDGRTQPHIEMRARI